MDLIQEILSNTKTIAVIGLKNDEFTYAYKIPLYMQSAGFKIYPVNPNLKGKIVLGEKVYQKVTNITDEIDLVNIFRRPEFLPAHAEEILNMKFIPKYAWFQLGIYNDQAAELLEKNGVKVVQNRCIMVEHSLLK